MITVRSATTADRAAIEVALIAAADWRGTAGTSRGHLSDPDLARYIDGWKRDSDLGVVAVDEQGAAVGAAWLRFFGQAAPGYGFVAPDIPELSMGVDAGARGQGIGRRLLSAMLDAARDAELPGVSLSVEDGNDPARHLYETSGFVVVGRNGDADTLVVRF